jgi:hypothetical protein
MTKITAMKRQQELLESRQFGVRPARHFFEFGSLSGG